MPKHGGCFDCGRDDVELLTSITIRPGPRKTVRGVVKSAGADSVSLCDECLAKEKARR